MDASIVIMDGSLLSRFLLLKWMVTLSILKVVCCRYLCYSNGLEPSHYGRYSLIDNFVNPMDGSIVIMDGSLFSRFLLLQWMVTLSLWKVVHW